MYGKFFGGKAGFVSLDCFPRFANVRRDGYDFDALYEDGKASIRCKKIMDCFALADELPSYELKNLAGFGKGGERNFEGTVAKLQQQAYLVIRAFRRRRNARGLEYGWPVAVYTPAERLVSPAHRRRLPRGPRSRGDAAAPPGVPAPRSRPPRTLKADRRSLNAHRHPQTRLPL